jgi:hypothetical protein
MRTHLFSIYIYIYVGTYTKRFITDARVGDVTARLLLSPTHALLYCTTNIVHCSTSVNFTARSSFALPYDISLLYHACQH